MGCPNDFGAPCGFQFHHEVKMENVDGSTIHSLSGVNCNNFNDSLTFHLAPLSGQHFLIVHIPTK